MGVRSKACDERRGTWNPACNPLCVAFSNLVFENRVSVVCLFFSTATTQNRLPDATCEMFKRTGECEGHNKETIRPLCPRSCQLRHRGHQSRLGGIQPIRTTPQIGSVFRKTHVPFWDQSANVIGQTLGLRIADTLISPISHPGSGQQYSRVSPSLKRHSTVFGTIPTRQSSSLFNLRQQQQQQFRQQQQQQERQRQLQPRRQLSSSGVAKWIPPVTKAR